MSDEAQPRTILVPLDLTPAGEVKIPVAEEYARALGADVLLLHVLRPGDVTCVARASTPKACCVLARPGQRSSRRR